MYRRYIKRILLTASILLALGAGGSFAVAQLHGSKVLSVQSGSMVPVLHKGDLISVIRVPDNQLKVGDIITYIRPSNAKQTITHRIIELPTVANSHRFVTKGDANRVADPSIPANKIIGRVTHNLPYAGYAIDFLHKPLGLAVLIWLPALMIIVEEIQRLKKYYSQAEPYVSVKVRTRLNTRGRIFNKKFLLAAKGSIFLLLFSVFIALPVYAALTSTATLTDTSITTRVVTPPTQCTGNSTNITVNGTNTGNNSNNVNINNNSSQTTTSGSTTVSGNTTTGSITTGNASNANCTNINITITNH